MPAFHVDLAQALYSLLSQQVGNRRRRAGPWPEEEELGGPMAEARSQQMRGHFEFEQRARWAQEGVVVVFVLCLPAGLALPAFCSAAHLSLAATGAGFIGHHSKTYRGWLALPGARSQVGWTVAYFYHSLFCSLLSLSADWLGWAPQEERGS